MHVLNWVGKAALRMLDRDARVLASGMAFFFLLSLFPLLSFAIWIYGLFLSPATTEQLILGEIERLPSEYTGFIRQQLGDAIGKALPPPSARSVLIGLLGLWSAMTAMKAMIQGLHMVAGEEDPPGLLGYHGLALLLCVVVILLTGMTYPLADSVGGWIANLPGLAFFAGQWTDLVNILLGGMCLGVTYRIILSRQTASLSGCFLGGAVAAITWFVAGRLLRLYLAFGSLDTVYGVLTGLVFFLIWLYVASTTVLFGGAIAGQSGTRFGR